MRVRVMYLWSIFLRIGMFFILWIRIEIEGKENITKDSCIYVSKHQSSLDAIFLPSILPRSVFVLKKELLSVPVFGPGIKGTGCIAIDRRRGMRALKDVVTQGKNRLAKKINVIIFPEGTRIKPKNHPEFHKSGLMLAKSSKHPFILVAHNAGSLASVGEKIVKPGKVTIVISKPINPQDYNLNELAVHSHQWIKKQMLRIEK